MPKDQLGVQLHKGQNVCVQLGQQMVSGQIVDIQESKLTDTSRDPRQPPAGQVVVMIPYMMPYLNTNGNPILRNIFVTKGQPEIGNAAFQRDPTEEN